MSEKRLDFKQFHPLDHWPWERRCWSRKARPGWKTPFYGGPLYHLRIAWEYKHRENLIDWWHRLVLCRLGHHRMTIAKYPRQKRRVRLCHSCGNPSVTQELPWRAQIDDLIFDFGDDESEQ